VIKSHQVAGGKLDVKKAISRSGGRGGGNRSSWRGNPRNEQWGGHHNSKYKSMYIFIYNYILHTFNI